MDKIFLAILLLLAPPVAANAPPPDGIIVRAIVPVCDTAEKIKQMWDVHVNGDETLAVHVLRQTEGCTFLKGMYRVIKTHETGWLPFADRAYWSARVELFGADGNTYHGIIVNDKVLPDKSA